VQQQLRLRALLMGAPMGLGALAAGFWLQGLMPSPSPVNGALLEAMLETPPPLRRTAADPRDDLRGVQAQRSRSQSGALGLVEPERGTPLQLDIRVALLRDAGSVQLSSTGPWWLRRADGAVVSQGGAGQVMTLASGRMPAPELNLDTTTDAAVIVDGRRYRGRVRVLQMPAGLLAVNHLPLEDYVASVVGAEMPSSWNREALKAQAVAARSYALAHMARPASRHWHLGSTTRWQAYRGLESATGRTRQATLETVGLILSYQGGIVESLYASTTALTLEAHGHLGASMSQHGAQDLASRGMHYSQILARYYPGAALARLRSGGR
jgi:hypothetical protein